jgi:hypothetical protein
MCYFASLPSRPRARLGSGHPAVHTHVALEAIRGISQRLMIRRLGFLKGLHVTAHALG